jgi:hypothetical protein
MPKKKIKLGDKVRDRISGFQGIVTCKLQYKTGCNRFQVSPDRIDKDGGIIEAEVFDEIELEVIKPEKPKKVNRKKGGYKPKPKDYRMR